MNPRSVPPFAQARPLADVLAKSAARAVKYREAYEEQLSIYRELVAETGRLAVQIEARLTLRPVARKAGPPHDRASVRRR